MTIHNCKLWGSESRRFCQWMDWPGQVQCWKPSNSHHSVSTACCRNLTRACTSSTSFEFLIDQNRMSQVWTYRHLSYQMNHCTYPSHSKNCSLHSRLLLLWSIDPTCTKYVDRIRILHLCNLVNTTIIGAFPLEEPMHLHKRCNTIGWLWNVIVVTDMVTFQIIKSWRF